MSGTSSDSVIKHEMSSWTFQNTFEKEKVLLEIRISVYHFADSYGGPWSYIQHFISKLKWIVIWPLGCMGALSLQATSFWKWLFYFIIWFVRNFLLQTDENILSNIRSSRISNASEEYKTLLNKRPIAATKFYINLQ